MTKYFRPKSLYKVKNIDMARKSVLKNLCRNINEKDKHYIKDKKPARSANIANAFVKVLSDLNNRLAIIKATIDKKFFENELKKAYFNLLKEENNVETFQKKIGVIELTNQTNTIIGSIANLKEQIAIKEAQIASMGNTLPLDYQKTQAALSSLRSQLSAIRGY